MNCLSSMQIFNSFQFHLAYDLSQLFFEWPGMDFQLSWYIIYDQLSGFQVPFPYTISFPNGQNARVANIIQRILPIVLMTTSPPHPMSNILLQFPLLSHISLWIFLSPLEIWSAWFLRFSSPYIFKSCYFFSGANACTNNRFHMFSVICFFYDFLFE